MYNLQFVLYIFFDDVLLRSSVYIQLQFFFLFGERRKEVRTHVLSSNCFKNCVMFWGFVHLDKKNNNE